MKKNLFIISCLILTSCSSVSENKFTSLNFQPNCQTIEQKFKEEAQKNIEEMGENAWMVDMEVFYSPKTKTCVGKYMASRKEGKIDDVMLFFIKNIGKNENIYFQEYTGLNPKEEIKAQKDYKDKVVLLRE